MSASPFPWHRENITGNLDDERLLILSADDLIVAFADNDLNGLFMRDGRKRPTPTQRELTRA